MQKVAMGWSVSRVEEMRNILKNFDQKTTRKELGINGRIKYHRIKED
jgi:hypothetical protein